jgi:hypothetical protein
MRQSANTRMTIEQIPTESDPTAPAVARRNAGLRALLAFARRSKPYLLVIAGAGPF